MRGERTKGKSRYIQKRKKKKREKRIPDHLKMKSWIEVDYYQNYYHEHQEVEVRMHQCHTIELQ